MSGNTEIDKQDTPPAVITRASAIYSDVFTLRATIQCIPWVGGGLDTLLAGSGQRWKGERVESLFRVIDARLRNLEHAPAISDVKEDEALYDLILFSAEQAVRTRSAEKRARFSNIIVNQLVRAASWEEPELAASLLTRLSDAHIAVLTAMAHATRCAAPFEGLRLTVIGEVKMNNPPDVNPIDLAAAMPNIKPATVKMIMSELIALGLAKDEGVGRWSTSGMTYFIPTESADWLLEWLSS